MSEIQYRVAKNVKDAVALMAKAGFPSPEPYVSDPVNVTSLSYQTAINGTAELNGKFDLKGAKLATPIGWSKDAGTDGHLTVGIKLAPGGKLSTADFEAHANGLQTKGQVRFEREGPRGAPLRI